MSDKNINSIFYVGRRVARILFVNIGGIGDTVMMSPLVKALKEQLGNSELSLLTIPRSRELSETIPGIDKIYTIPLTYKMPRLSSILETFRVAKDLRNNKYDALVNLRAISTPAGCLKMFALVKIIGAGFSSGRAVGGLGFFYDYSLRETDLAGLNEVALTARLLEPLGIRDVAHTITLNSGTLEPGAAAQEFAESYLKRMGISGRPLIGVHPGAFRPSRRWPEENWRELITGILDAYPDCSVAVTGAAGDKSIADSLKISPRVFVTAGELGILETAALCKNMDAFITNDTGPMHLAAAVGTKVVAIFGPGDVVRYAPSVPTDKYRIVRRDNVQCSRPCYKYECSEPICLRSISAAEVLSALKELL